MAGELVDLDVERDAVVGDDGDRRRAQRAERRAVAGAAAGDDPAPAGDLDGRTGHRDAHRAGGDSRDPASHVTAHPGHSFVDVAATIRPPILVTIS